MFFELNIAKVFCLCIDKCSAYVLTNVLLVYDKCSTYVLTSPFHDCFENLVKGLEHEGIYF
jgi:hypothetical protein